MAEKGKEMNSSASSGASEKKSAETKNEKKEKKIVQVTPSEDYDLSRLTEYSGHTKIFRYLFVAERCKKFEAEAYKTAIAALKQTQNTHVYRKVFERLGEALGPSFGLDQAWADSVDKKAQQQLDRLEHELETAKTSLIKESIRMGNTELGNFHYHRGDMNSALRCYVKARDYCTSGEHIIEMCMNVIRVSIELSNFAHVLNYVAKAEQTPELKDKATIAKLKACAGLAHLEGRKYKNAAKKFIETSFDIGHNFSEILLPQDIAIYGGFCALASYDRQQLKTVIDNPQFKNFLELVPSIRDLINDFYNSKYASFLDNLEKFRLDLQLDLHLHDHIQGLYEKIRNKAIVQYFSPFVSIELKTMAEAFKTDITSLEKELSRLIMDGVISARIDSHNKRLYVREVDERTTTFDKALKMGSDFETHTKSLLLRVNLVRNDFIVKLPRNEKSEFQHQKKPNN
eukprot:TRINITY_DN425_c0_g1_i2.p1 TRINITY_DN425_c0_g1~~TRINITY_DN425_c0_g1_i2.p1  ORF type:complete len:467 (-),score=86.86 TRINITY_DN425_c0_g1_i2:119-1489(-)